MTGPNSPPPSPVEPFDFPPEFQQKILAALLLDPHLLIQYRHILRAAYWNDATLRQIAEWVLAFYDAYATKPTKAALTNTVHTHCGQSPALAGHVGAYCAWIEHLYMSDLSDLEYIKEHLHSFVETREYMLAIKKAIPKLKDPEQRKTIVEDIMQAQLAVSKTKGKIGTPLIAMTAEQRWKYLFETPARDVIPSLWTSYNEKAGGYAKKELTMFAGSPNRGKSWALCHAGSSCLAAGKRCIFYSLEMSEELISTRLYSMLCGMSEYEMKMNPQKVEQIIAYYRNIGSELIPVQMYNAQVKDIREHLMAVQAQCGWIPDMVVVDYAALLAAQDIDADYRVISSICRSLRAIAVQYDLAMVSAAQLNRGADKKEKPQLADLAECYEQAAIADVLWMLCQTDDEIATNRMRLYNAKMRNAPRGALIPLQLELSHGLLQDCAPTGGVGAFTAPSGFSAPSGPPPSLNPFGS